MLNKALNIESPSFSRYDFLKGTRELESAGALLYLIIYDYEHDEYIEKEQVHTAIKEKLKSILYEHKEPTFENSHNWGYPALCQCFALLKNKEELWNLFNEEEKEKITFFMRMFLYMWNFGCNAENNYNGTWGLHGNYHKYGSPNYMFSNDAILPYVASFFGDKNDITNTSEIIEHFHWGKEKDYMLKCGFNNAYQAWTAKGVVTEEGHPYAGAYSLLTKGAWLVTEDIEYGVKNYNIRGNGKGVGIPLAYKVPSKTENITLPNGLISLTFQKCFSKICQTSIPVAESTITCTTSTGEISPYEGQHGMMLEFNSADFNTRSSLFHCSLDFVLATTAITTLKLLDIVDITKEPYWDTVKVGMEDYLFKKENNYVGYSMGRIEPEDPVDITLWKNYWENNYR